MDFGSADALCASPLSPPGVAHSFQDFMPSKQTLLVQQLHERVEYEHIRVSQVLEALKVALPESRLPLGFGVRDDVDPSPFLPPPRFLPVTQRPHWIYPPKATRGRGVRETGLCPLYMVRSLSPTH